MTKLAAIAIISGAMKTFSLAALLGVSLAAGASRAALAQNAETLPTAKTEAGKTEAGKTEAAGKKMRVVKIINVPSALVAYRLDPAHNARPASFAAGELPVATDKGAPTLPDGIDEIVSIDSQNLILIRGESYNAIGQAQNLIAVLDQPVGQVEMEAQFVEMAKSELKNFAIDASGPRENAPSVEFGFVRHDFSARLNALVANGKAKIIWAPRVSELSQLTARIIRTDKEIVDGEPVTVTNNYRITPATDGADTMKLVFKITENENNEAEETGRSTLTDLRAGDTIALQDVMSAQYHLGNTIALMTVESMRPTDPNRVVVVFLTPRFIASIASVGSAGEQK